MAVIAFALIAISSIITVIGPFGTVAVFVTLLVIAVQFIINGILEVAK